MPIPLLAPDDATTPFPPLDQALSEPNGLLMAGGSLTPRRLLMAYRRGIFPWYSEGEPVLWWSPDPRCVLWPSQLRVSRSLAKSARNRGYTVRRNAAFADVIRACADSRRHGPGTWLVADMIDAYCELHALGYAASFECWCGDDLVGGLYGVRLGAVFFGESMFSRERDASKVALMRLCDDPDLAMVDCQLASPHLFRLGAVNLPRAIFLQALAAHLDAAPEAPSIE